MCWGGPFDFALHRDFVLIGMLHPRCIPNRAATSARSMVFCLPQIRPRCACLGKIVCMLLRCVLNSENNRQKVCFFYDRCSANGWGRRPNPLPRQAPFPTVAEGGIWQGDVDV